MIYVRRRDKTVLRAGIWHFCLIALILKIINPLKFFKYLNFWRNESVFSKKFTVESNIKKKLYRRFLKNVKSRTEYGFITAPHIYSYYSNKSEGVFTYILKIIQCFVMLIFHFDHLNLNFSTKSLLFGPVFYSDANSNEIMTCIYTHYIFVHPTIHSILA